MNYLEELQKINEDYKKCKNVIKSCVWDNQLESAGTYCNNFVSYHAGRLGFYKRTRYSFRYTIYDWLRKEYSVRKKILEYIDLCVEELKYMIECQSGEVYQSMENKQIGYGDKNLQTILRIQQEVKKWEEKKQKDNIYNENRKITREKLQVN